jgi:hypothetical protein
MPSGARKPPTDSILDESCRVVGPLLQLAPADGRRSGALTPDGHGQLEIWHQGTHFDGFAVSRDLGTTVPKQLSGWLFGP